jgi:predicted DNA-binding transcriptional regulator AlpA
MKPAFYRLKEIVGRGKMIPISPASWWNGVRVGRYPKPVKLGPRTTAWRAEDIHQLVDDLGAAPQSSGQRVPER